MITPHSFLSRSLATLCIGLMALTPMQAEINPKPFVVPELKTWQGQEGSVRLSGRIIVKDKRLADAAQALIADAQRMGGKAAGLKLTIAKGSARQGDIVLSRGDAKRLGKEGYALTLGDVITLSAGTERGAYWGTRTLLQLIETHADGTLPKGQTTDTPDYKLRGFMIDCGRKYIPMSYLRDLVKVMSYYKLNTLQVHLNDNGFRQYFGNDWMKTQAAFRLESDTYPGLTAKDGSYTKAEFRNFQRYADSLGVEIIPEIDVPAHSLAFTQYKPELGSKEYGMDHLDLFNSETIPFVDGLFKEYLGGKDPVFIGPRVNVGTDEYSNAKKDVVEKFRAFTDHCLRIVKSYGKQPAAWGALTHAKGDTPVMTKGVMMNCWYNGYADPKVMKELGCQLVSIPDGLVYIVPAAGYYYDYLNCDYLYKNWTPAQIGNAKFEERDPAIEGGMFAVWNDHVGNGISVKDIHHRVFPALQTMSTKMWTATATKLPYAQFDSLRLSLSEAPGINELGRLGKTGDVPVKIAKVEAGATLPVEEIGYNYAVTFTIDAKAEDKGTELFRSSSAVFYLSDPKEGKLGFERDGYLNTFNYRLPSEGRVTLTIEGDNRETRLFVNGQLREKLGPKTLYVMRDKDRAHYQVEGASPYEPVVYAPTDQIYYQRTLVFPLRKAGQFKSMVSDLKVEVR